MSDMAPKNESTNRRRARELALQILFQNEFLKGVDVGTSLNYFREQLDIPQASLEYAEKILLGIDKNAKQIDDLIAEKSRNWKISRMSPVDLSLLRIGTFELVINDAEIPAKVAIDEAIEIAKRYGGTESTQFINGILDEILRTKG